MVRDASCGLLLLLLASCGGRTEVGSPGSGEPGEPRQPGEQPAAGSDDPLITADGDTELGSCTLGFSVVEANGKPCAWLADNRCYEERQMACNCICPRTRDSQCSSGFDDGPDGRVWVECR